jgi:hypothetical protein
MPTAGFITDAVEIIMQEDVAAIDTAMDQRSESLPRAIHPYSNELLQLFVSSLSLAPAI